MKKILLLAYLFFFVCSTSALAQTRTSNPPPSDEAYGSTWDGIARIAPSKNAIYDYLESGAFLISANISNTAYDATSWDGVTTIAPSKNAIRDYIELLKDGFLFLDQDDSPTVAGELLYDNTVAGIDGGGLAFYDGTRIRYVVDLQTLPSDDNYVVTYNSANQLFEMQPGGSASVAGDDTQVQFNDGDAMGADAGLTYNKTTDVLTATGGFVAGATDDPATYYDPSTASESEWWTGVNHDSGGDDNDPFEIRQSATPGTNVRFKVDASTGKISSGDLPASGTDPDVDAAGEIGRDTDDHSLRGYDGSVQYVYGQKIKTIQVTVSTPNDLADATRDKCPIWSNETGFSFIITGIKAWADTDDTAFVIDEFDADGASNTAEVDSINCTTGSGPYTASETPTITIENGHTLFVDFDDTDDPGWVKISIIGYLDGDVD